MPILSDFNSFPEENFLISFSLKLITKDEQRSRRRKKRKKICKKERKIEKSQTWKIYMDRSLILVLVLVPFLFVVAIFKSFVLSYRIYAAQYSAISSFLLYKYLLLLFCISFHNVLDYFSFLFCCFSVPFISINF